MSLHMGPANWNNHHLITWAKGSLKPYLIFVTDTTDSVCVKKKLPGVNIYRFNAKNWQFTVYFAIITQKNGNLLCILS